MPSYPLSGFSSTLSEVGREGEEREREKAREKVREEGEKSTSLFCLICFGSLVCFDFAFILFVSILMFVATRLCTLHIKREREEERERENRSSYQ